MSAAGEIAIPQDVRASLNWGSETPLELVRHPDGVLLRQQPTLERTLTIEEFYARVPPHDGPPVTLEEMNEGVMRAARESYPPRS